MPPQTSTIGRLAWVLVLMAALFSQSISLLLATIKSIKIRSHIQWCIMVTQHLFIALVLPCCDVHRLVLAREDLLWAKRESSEYYVVLWFTEDCEIYSILLILALLCPKKSYKSIANIQQLPCVVASMHYVATFVIFPYGTWVEAVSIAISHTIQGRLQSHHAIL